MPDWGIGSFLSGALHGAADYTAEERKRQRDLEDQQFEQQRGRLDQLRKLADEGKIDPYWHAQIFSGLTGLDEAQRNPKRAKGMAGFFGKSTPYVAPIFQALSQGGVPLTEEQRPGLGERVAAQGRPVMHGAFDQVPTQVGEPGQTVGAPPSQPTTGFAAYIPSLDQQPPKPLDTVWHKEQELVPASPPALFTNPYAKQLKDIHDAYLENNPGTTPEGLSDVMNQASEKLFGIAPKWTSVPGVVQGKLVQAGTAMDYAGNPFVPQPETYYSRRAAPGGRVQYTPTSPPQSVTGGGGAINDRDAIALELNGKKFGQLAPGGPEQAGVNKELARRQNEQAKYRIDITSQDSLDRAGKTYHNVAVMDPSGTVYAAQQNQLGKLDRPFNPNWPVIQSDASLFQGKKFSQAGTALMMSANVLEGLFPGIVKELEDSGKSTDNNLIDPMSQKFLYSTLGIAPEDEQLLQSIGITEAYGLRGLLGGRPNQTLMDIYRSHLPQLGDTWKLAYEKMKGLVDTLPKIQKAVVDSESMTTRPRIGEGPPPDARVLGRGPGPAAGIANPPAAPTSPVPTQSFVGPTPPTNPQDKQVWVNTSPDPNVAGTYVWNAVLKQWIEQ